VDPYFHPPYIFKRKGKIYLLLLPMLIRNKYEGEGKNIKVTVVYQEGA
jgi:hypothetical protein